MAGTSPEDGSVHMLLGTTSDRDVRVDDSDMGKVCNDLLRACKVHIKRVKVCDGCIHVPPRKNMIRGMMGWIRRITKEVENTHSCQH
jgi:hypothetical protein